MKQYNSSFDTGIDWLGKIPKEWSLLKIKELFNERNEKNDFNSSDYLSVVKDVGVIPYSEKGNVGNKTSDVPEKYKMVHPFDIVLNPMNVQIGSVGISKYTGCLSSIYVVLVHKNGVNPFYYDYLFRIKTFQRYLRTISYGILEIRESINKIEFFVQKLPFPPFEQQQQIVDFLNIKIPKIDDLIQKKLQKIELRVFKTF